MPAPIIAPWLDTKPTDFVQAAEAGNRIGLERRAQDAAMAEKAAELSQRQAELGSTTNLDLQRLKAQQQNDQAKMQLATQIAAKKFQAQQEYQNALKSGMDPVQALMQFGPQMGGSMSGAGQLGMQQFREKQAALPPQIFNDPNDPNRALGVTYGGRFHAIPQPRAAASVPKKLDPGTAAYVQALQRSLNGAMPQEKPKILKEIKDLTMPDQADDSSQEPQAQYEYDPNAEDPFQKMGQ